MPKRSSRQRLLVLIMCASPFLAGPAFSKPLEQPRPASETSDDAEQAKWRARAEKQQKDWDADTAISMKSICGNCGRPTRKKPE